MTRTTRLLIASILFLGCGEFVSQDRAVKAATDEGYTHVTVTGQHGISPHYVGGCDSSDSVAFDVTATNNQQRRVSFTVCCGLVMKGCTIRH